MREERRKLEELSLRECMELLSSVSLGRVVFTARALPAIRPASHLVDGDQLIIGADRGAAITSALRADVGTVVAYEADAIDPVDHLGWSVTVVGVARPLADSPAAGSFRRVLAHGDGDGDGQVISIQADMVTGFRWVADGPR